MLCPKTQTNCKLLYGWIADDNAPERSGPLRKTPTPETVQAMDREKPGHEQKQEHIIEVGHYLGIGR